jgi:hypothetical protein
MNFVSRYFFISGIKLEKCTTENELWPLKTRFQIYETVWLRKWRLTIAKLLKLEYTLINNNSEHKISKVSSI